MLKTVSFLLAGCLFGLVWGMGNMIDHGLWEVKAVNECGYPNPTMFNISMTKHKYTRFVDAYNCSMRLAVDMDSSYGIRIDICKWVDGGCKDYQVITDANVVDFIKKMAEGNCKSALQMMGKESGEFPLEAGEYECVNYLIDYCEFSCKSVIGLFGAEVQLLDKDGNMQACILATVEFREPEGDEELCEKCKEE